MVNFHGYNKKKNFFEGWYFKHQCGNDTVSFIPGVNIGMDGNRMAFIQVITKNKSYDLHYSYSDFSVSDGNLEVRIGDNLFSKSGIDVNIEDKEVSIKGSIKYEGMTPFTHNIMGPFSKFPFMECNHEIISMYHRLKGSLTINDETINFDKGVGYIEKDWGSSFPKNYIWVQGNDFKESRSSVMASVAEIPFLGFKFRGCIAVVNYNGMEYRFATYNGTRILRAEESGITLYKKKERLEIDITRGMGHKLKSPVNGEMKRNIREHPNCKGTFRLYINDKVEFTLKSDNCSFEYVKNEHVPVDESHWKM